MDIYTSKINDKKSPLNLVFQEHKIEVLEHLIEEGIVNINKEIKLEIHLWENEGKKRSARINLHYQGIRDSWQNAARVLISIYNLTSKNDKVIRHLIRDEQRDVESVKNESGVGSFTTLMDANSSMGYNELMEALASHGVNVNVQDSSGNTDLTDADRNKYNEVADELIKQDTNVNVQDSSGNTDLTDADRNKYNEVADELIKQDTNVNVQDSSGNTDLTDADRNKYNEVADELIKQDTDVNVQAFKKLL